MLFYAECGDKKYNLDIYEENGFVVVKSGSKLYRVVLDNSKRCIRNVVINNHNYSIGWSKKDELYDIILNGMNYQVLVENAKYRAVRSAKGAKKQTNGFFEVSAPIPGLVTSVGIKPGDKVVKGDPLLTLDAMKLENEIRAPFSGVVKSVKVKERQTVDKGFVMVVIDV